MSDAEQYDRAARRYPTVVLVDRRLIEENRRASAAQQPHNEKGVEQSKIDPMMPV